MSTLNLIMVHWHDHGFFVLGTLTPECHTRGTSEHHTSWSRLGQDSVLTTAPAWVERPFGRLSLNLTLRVGLSPAVSTSVPYPPVHPTTVES